MKMLESANRSTEGQVLAVVSKARNSAGGMITERRLKWILDSCARAPLAFLRTQETKGG